ncbi:oxidoreductase [Dictyobacter alpinus]|uniref:Oxidoreductase n=1 Tax=Dictyobacter alpinus TaxID=2014873 RepID=A0A402BB72_9CHLR|nr:NADH:flavin oxidoreductase/NADH oxidase [Dictyobacter alpinus]GCE28556.1 oxidoreductase [Dictyobacter alpinus]
MNPTRVHPEENQDQIATVPLFTPYKLRGLTFRNRIVVSPMCQYSSHDGFANDWHLVHLGQFAIGGAALVLAEATAIEARGRITPQDLGIYKDEHIPMLARIVTFIREQGAIAGMQLSHAGRKASTYRPWSGHGKIPAQHGGWQTVAPSAEAFSDTYPVPAALTHRGIAEIVQNFRRGAERALSAGFQVLEIHAAHGYLLHEFLSPLSNKREDEYGGSLQNRLRFLLEVCDAVRKAMPENLPLLVRISATDWAEGGLTGEDAVEIASALSKHGVDLIDTSTGGNVPNPIIPVGPGYQVPFAEDIRHKAHIPTGVVGLIIHASQANKILEDKQADMIFLARELLRDPHWPLQAARKLHYDITWPDQYLRARL